jgi:hypoxanthine phosphoribosyltransferase
MDKRIMTWGIYDVIIKKIIKAIKQSGKQYKTIGTFAQNGYIPAVHIAKHLDIRNLIDLDQYEPVEIWHMDNMLVVDDISDTGDTLKWCTRHDIACICFKKGTSVMPTYPALEYKKNDWVNFPWEPDNEEMKRNRDHKELCSADYKMCNECAGNNHPAGEYCSGCKMEDYRRAKR